MALPFKVDTLDEIDEEHRALYKEKDGAFMLEVEGAKPADDIAALERAYERTKTALAELKAERERLSADDLEELEQLRADRAAREEEEAREAGKFDELRAKLVKKHEKELAEKDAALTERDKVIETLTVTNQLRSAIADAGIEDGYREAVESMLLRRGPKVKWRDGEEPVGVFPDEVEGDKPIAEYVAEWAKGDNALRFMPPEYGGGGGGGGQETHRGSGKAWEGKDYGDMTPEEKIEYTQAQYESGAYGPRSVA